MVQLSRADVIAEADPDMQDVALLEFMQTDATPVARSIAQRLLWQNRISMTDATQSEERFIASKVDEATLCMALVSESAMQRSPDLRDKRYELAWSRATDLSRLGQTVDCLQDAVADAAETGLNSWRLRYESVRQGTDIFCDMDGETRRVLYRVGRRNRRLKPATRIARSFGILSDE